MAHLFTFLPIIVMPTRLNPSPHTIKCPIDISDKVKPVGHNDRVSQSLFDSCFKGLTHIHDDDFHLCTILSKVVLNGILISIWKDINWFLCDSIRDNELVLALFGVPFVFIDSDHLRQFLSFFIDSLLSQLIKAPHY